MSEKYVEVLARAYTGSSIYCGASTPGYQYMIALPIGKLPLEFKEHLWKNAREGDEYFMFENMFGPWRHVYDAAHPDGNLLFAWRRCWLKLDDEVGLTVEFNGPPAADSKERRFWFRHGYNLALVDAVDVVTRLAQLSRATTEEKTALYYAADVIRKKEKMDNNSAESKEIDAALLAQCTCGGVAGSRSCDIECAIFDGCARKPVMTEEQAKENRAAGKWQHFTEICTPHVASFDKELVDKAQELITASLSYIERGVGPYAPMTENNLNLLRMAIDTPKPVIHDDIKECPHCESTEIAESVVEKDSSLFEGEDKIEVKYKVQLRTCTECQCGWLDYRAEEAEMQALYKALFSEVVRLRAIVKERDREIDILRTFNRVVPS